MSLPTLVKAYKNGELIGHVHYNIGWFSDDLRLARDMRQLMEEVDCGRVEVYGHTFDTATIDEEIMLIEAYNENYRFDMQKKAAKLRAEIEAKGHNPNTINIGQLRTHMPKLIAEQIVGVQPMQAANTESFFKMKPMEAPTGKIFKLDLTHLNKVSQND